jgi:hypothetical protein
MRRRDRNPAQRLRSAVDALPARTKEAMLDGIARNRIIVGAYVDPRSGGICPMLAAHRNGGRTSVASFARAWDAYTGARRPRRATRREVRVLRSQLECSLARDGLAATSPSPDIEDASIAELAAQIRVERGELAGCAIPEPPDPDGPADPRGAEVTRTPNREIRLRRRRHDPYLDLLTIAEQALADGGNWERVVDPERVAR